MASRDFQLPDDFPDLTLPDREDRPVEPMVPPKAPRPEEPWKPPASTASTWRIGDHVLAPREQQDSEVWERSDNLQPAEIRDIRAERAFVCFEDDNDEAWVPLAMLRSAKAVIPAVPRPMRVFQDQLRFGDRVWAPWNAGTLFPGTVDKIDRAEVHISFDDGDRGWILRHQVQALEVTVGQRVLGRWNMGRAYLPGTVAAVNGSQIQVRYDNGNSEWTHFGALACPCNPSGPDARPDYVASPPASSGFSGGWVVWIIICIVLGILRAGCR